MKTGIQKKRLPTRNMKYLDEYKNPDIALKLISKICDLSEKLNGEVNLMEVCGTHTMAIGRTGIRKLIGNKINLLSGPGCPVCVSPDSYLSRAIAYSEMKDVIITTFGDMLRVPVSGSTLYEKRAEGSSVVAVYSPADALKVAEDNPGKKIIFLAVGFETTAPTIAATIKNACEKNVTNFFILSGHKLIPPALRILVKDTELKVNGFICPGHVSTIIGKEPYDFLAEDYNLPCVIGGFEPLDVIQTIFMLLRQLIAGEAKVEIQYSRAVKDEGNGKARDLMYEVFEVCDSEWRGLGNMTRSGLKLREKYLPFDAEVRFPVNTEEKQGNTDCICGEILRGIKKPLDCRLFGTMCTPENPVGPCMVSSEGTCAAYFRYG